MRYPEETKDNARNHETFGVSAIADKAWSVFVTQPLSSCFIRRTFLVFLLSFHPLTKAQSELVFDRGVFPRESVFYLLPAYQPALDHDELESYSV
jgi:hypothetical protein